MADLALANAGAAPAAGIAYADEVCFPLIAGDDAVGVLGIDATGGLTTSERQTMGAAAAMVAIALRNAQLFFETRAHGVHDRLTGCFNHEHGLETLDAELRRAKRSGRPLAVVMFDIDHFKSINDRFGHLRGDDILRAVGAQLTRVLRTSDVSCRYGGDEFLLILPETDRAGAVRVAEILLLEIATLAITASREAVLKVTASIGVTTAAPGEIAVAALVKRADDALYQSKAAGRNRFSVADPPSMAAAPDTREPGADIPAPSAVKESRGTETILVADDEPLIHEMVRQILESRGYQILTAKNGAAAIAVGQDHRGSIALLLTDMVMPDLLGPELANRIRHLRPDIKVVYMSGFSDHLAALGPGAACLDKPFTAISLSTTVRQTLDAASLAH
jgi:diguanylate cyclase (GGDEF)-like protein